MRLAAHASFRRTVLANGLLTALLAGQSVCAWAQVADAAKPAGADAGASAATGSAAALASEGTTKRTFSFEPRLTILQTFTSNAELRAGGGSDQITEINPGFRLVANGSRLKAYADYTLRDVIYAQNSSKSSALSSLNAFGNLRAIDNWAFLDFRSTISQQAISAFGSQVPDNGPINTNLSQTFNTQLSPYIVGRLGGAVNYELRYNWATNRSESNAASNLTTREALLNLRGETGASRLSWSANLGSHRYDYDNGRATRDDIFRVVVGYAVSPQLTLSAIGGRETNNFISLTDETHNSSGWGVNWIPSDTTRLSLSRENRFFGESHSLTFDHRGRRTEWRYSDTRDVSANPNQSGAGSAGTLYDLIFAQMASLEPDPIKRADLVNAFLLAYGLSPDSKAPTGFLTSAVTLQRAQNLSFAILGIRDTITFIATQTQTRRLDTLSTANDDLARGAGIQQRGFSVNYAHRLTPMSSFSVSAMQTESSGSAAASDASTRRLFLNFTTKLGTQSTASLGARRVLSDGGLAPYTESALTGSLNLQF